ncbi:cleavage/polyadenylation factor CFT1 PWA37_004547 [Arxiozyma heterogenica]|uniref:cleavage/polyadenylation factor CFT1 n=1 Tax=Arxiozyma heterogenica TaxID=278026 RepID=UPI002F163EC2
MNIYDDILEPSVVSHSLTGYFTTTKYKQLLVLKTNILTVFNYTGDSITLEHEFKFNGKITDMAVIHPSRFNNNNNNNNNSSNKKKKIEESLDYLLLCIGLAKFSILKFDPTHNCLNTISLHYYENKFMKSSIMELAKKSQLRIDPLNKCVLLFNNDNIAILPILLNLRDDEDDDDDYEDDQEENKNSIIIDGPIKKRAKIDNNNNHASNNHITNAYDTINPPTGPSAIFQAKYLDSDIQNVIDIQFLSNFTKPTIMIIYQPKLVWVGNEKLNPLPTKLAIINIDLKINGKKTVVEPTIISKLDGLDWGYHSLLPITNGSLLIGNNHLAYIDNTGIIQNVILLNSFADKNWKKTKVIDNSNLEITFNKSAFKYLWSPPILNSNNMGNVTSLYSNTTNNKEVGGLTDADNKELILLIDENVNFYYVQMEFEGRLLSKFDIFNLPIVNDIFINNKDPTCVTRVDTLNNNSTIDLFIGFQTGDSLIVKLNNIKSTLTTRDEHIIEPDDTQLENYLNDSNQNEDDEDDDMDDLYSDDNVTTENKEHNLETQNDIVYSDNKDTKEMIQVVEPFNIEVITNFNNIGPITSMSFGKVTSIEKTIKGLVNPNQNEHSLVTTSGNGTGSHLTSILFSVQPIIEQALKFISVTQIWNLKFRNKDKYLITTDFTKSKSDIYEIDNNFALYKGGRLRRDATTVYISMFGDGKRIVQVTTNHLYLFDLTFRRLTTIKFDYEVVHVSVMDPYVLVTLSRGDINIFELDTRSKRKLFRVPLPDILKEMVITSGLIVKSNMCNDFFANLPNPDAEQMLFTFVTADNQIICFIKEHSNRIFQLNGVSELNEELYISTYMLPDEIVPDPSIKQIMINKLGKDNKEEYLTILTFGGEIYQYKKSSTRYNRFYKGFSRNNLAVTGAPDNAYAKGVSQIERIMHYISNYNGFSVIFVTGTVPYIIIKEDYSVPRIFKFANIPLVSMTSWGKQSIMCVDDIKNARVYTLDVNNIYYGNMLPLKKININTTLDNYMTLTNITYHEKSETFIVSYSKEIEFVAVGEDNVKITVGTLENVSHAKSFKSGILLINPRTWNVIDQVEYDNNTLVSDVKTMLIQLDSKTKRKIEYVVVGITNVTSEDMPASGAFFIYDVISVVPEPGKPDTVFKFKQFFKEDVKSAVTKVCDMSGRFVVSQSQKLMVRDAQEDNSVVPVAFLDVPLYVTDIKSFSNLLLVGDAMQGIQFVGFDAEPYRMISLGKSISKLKTMSLEFLVNHGDLYFAVSDRDDILHILKYAPDEPNSLSGQRLIHCSSFNIYSTNTCMILTPKNEEFNENEQKSNSYLAYQALGAQTDGSIFKVVPLKEDSYRRLYFVHKQLCDKETPLGGINVRMERQNNEFLKITRNLRPMLDGNVIRKYTMLPIAKRKNIARRLGRNAHFDIWREIIDLEFSLRTLSQ